MAIVKLNMSQTVAKLRGNPGKIYRRITLWYRVIGGIVTELAIAYSLHTASRLCRSRKPIGAGTITLDTAEAAILLEVKLKSSTDRNTSTSFSGSFREVLAETTFILSRNLSFWQVVLSL
jgi:hypothetical protein